MLFVLGILTGILVIMGIAIIYRVIDDRNERMYRCTHWINEANALRERNEFLHNELLELQSKLKEMNEET